MAKITSLIRIFVSIGIKRVISGESCPVKNSQPIVLLSLTFASLAERIGVLTIELGAGKLADRIGNRPILLLVGILVAITPLFWLGTSQNVISMWVWLPLLHLLSGGTWAAIDLCSNNIQMSIVPTRNQATYFAIAAAVAGVGGALA